MSWRVLATARNFLITDDARAYLEDNDCTLVASVYGGDANDAPMERAEMIELLSGVDGAITAGTIDQLVFDSAPALRIISRRGVGYDRIDVPAATRRGIPVTTTPGAMDDAVADHAFALLLAVARRIPYLHEQVVGGSWNNHMGAEVAGQTLGIIGLGRIGAAIARRGKGFGMRLLAYDQRIDESLRSELGVEYVELDDLLQGSDFVSVSTSLNDSSKHLIGHDELARMKSSAFLINTSRGGVIDQDALLQALREGTIAGAGLDTFETEPLVNFADFAALPNLVASPHVGGYTIGAVRKANVMAARNVVSFLNGKPDELVGLVNPDYVGKGIA